MTDATAWDTAYWCSAHETAHTARDLIREHNARPAAPAALDARTLRTAMAVVLHGMVTNGMAEEVVREYDRRPRRLRAGRRAVR